MRNRLNEYNTSVDYIEQYFNDYSYISGNYIADLLNKGGLFLFKTSEEEDVKLFLDLTLTYDDGTILITRMQDEALVILEEDVDIVSDGPFDGLAPEEPVPEVV